MDSFGLENWELGAKLEIYGNLCIFLFQAGLCWAGLSSNCTSCPGCKSSSCTWRSFGLLRCNVAKLSTEPSSWSCSAKKPPNCDASLTPPMEKTGLWKSLECKLLVMTQKMWSFCSTKHSVPKNSTLKAPAWGIQLCIPEWKQKPGHGIKGF